MFISFTCASEVFQNGGSGSDGEERKAPLVREWPEHTMEG